MRHSANVGSIATALFTATSAGGSSFGLDPAVLHHVWDATWNRWKHLLGAKMEVNATFVKSAKYRWQRSDWQLVIWETALPSRLEIKLPADFEQQVEAAKRTYHRFGR